MLGSILPGDVCCAARWSRHTVKWLERRGVRSAESAGGLSAEVRPPSVGQELAYPGCVQRQRVDL